MIKKKNIVASFLFAASVLCCSVGMLLHFDAKKAEAVNDVEYIVLFDRNSIHKVLL